MNLDLIDDETLDAIPDNDPGAAFALIERACRSSMLRELSETDDWRVIQELRLDYMNDVVAAAQFYDIEGIRDFALPNKSEYPTEYFEDFSRRVRFFTMHLRLTAKTSKNSYTVELLGSHKERIRTLVQHLKDFVDRAEFSDSKKDLLQKRIREFEAALDGKRIKFAEAMVFLSLIGSGIHAIGEGAEGAGKLVHEITILIGQSKEIEDNTVPMLPRYQPPPPMYLEAKIEQPAHREKSAADLDDEIPF